MSPDERRCSISSTHSVSLNKMGSEVTESTNAPGHHDSVYSPALETLMDVGKSGIIDTIEPRGLITSSNPPPMKTYEEREVLYALQTSYNSLHFLPKREEGIRRSNSFSLPSYRNIKQDEVSNDQVMWKFNFGCRGGKLPQVRKTPLQMHKDLEQEERVFDFGKNKREVLTETVPEELRTSVMLRRIPKDYTRDDILQLLHEHECGEINFLCLPIGVGTCRNVGYAFINFRFPQDALEFKSLFTGHLFFPQGSGPEEGACVEWRYPIQGFASHFDQSMRSYITHSPQLPPEFKPTLVRDGKAIPFPEPWAEIKICQETFNFIKKLRKCRFIGVADFSGVEREGRQLWAKKYKLKKYKKV